MENSVFRPLPLPRPVCWHFRQHGSCSRGETCRFAHVDSEQGPQNRPSTTGAKNYFWLYRMPADPNEFTLLVQTLEAHGFRRATTPEEESLAVLLWCGSSTVPKALRLDGSPLPQGLVVNRLGCGASITQKDRLIFSLRLNSREALAPQTWILPAEHEELVRNCRQSSFRAPFIVKPFNAGCGRGVFLTTEPEHLTPGVKCVVSRYIDRPLLVDEKKLDLRLFVLVLSKNARQASPDAVDQGREGRGRDVFVSQHGLVRFAAHTFSCLDLQTGASRERECRRRGEAGDAGCEEESDNCEGSSRARAGVGGEFDPRVHLTYIDSHDRQLHRKLRAKQWTIRHLLTWIAANPEYGPARARFFWRAVCQLAVRTIQCLPQHASMNGGESEPSTAFELFGFDILPDRELRPWLLEVNSQPDLGATSKNGGSVYAAEHEAKANTVAGVLTVALREGLGSSRTGPASAASCTRDAEELGRSDDMISSFDAVTTVARNLGLERAQYQEDVGREWWSVPVSGGGGVE